jgi:hypothetical protein
MSCISPTEKAEKVKKDVYRVLVDNFIILHAGWSDSATKAIYDRAEEIINTYRQILFLKRKPFRNREEINRLEKQFKALINEN